MSIVKCNYDAYIKAVNSGTNHVVCRELSETKCVVSIDDDVKYIGDVDSQLNISQEKHSKFS